MKTGLYNFMGNSVEYYEGEDVGYDLDSASDVPVEALALMGEYVCPLD
ncbi:MAG TPA: hypothetical protein PKH10_08235 [bacterium]|nr:hypothetical protein [bacterium]